MARQVPLHDEIRQNHRDLDFELRGRYGMSFKTYKIIKAVTVLAGVAAGIYAMSLGAPPLASFALIVLIISGPEVFEYLVINGH